MSCIMEFYVILTVLGSVFFISDAAPVSQKPEEDYGEYGGYFEGDMILTAAQRAEIDKARILLSPQDDEDYRNGLLTCSQHWPNKTVVYHIQNHFDKTQLRKIYNAMSDIENQTCIKFRKRKREDEHAVSIQGKQHGCFASVGYVREGADNEAEGQVINLAKICFQHGIIVHEMLHCLGFFHMQSTFDRDKFVTIVWDNIRKGMGMNFAKYTRATVTDYGVPYDYGSVMHYSSKSFSINGKDTIVPKQANVIIGQREGLSKSDVLKLNTMYECRKEKKIPPNNKTPLVIPPKHNKTSLVIGLDKFFAFLS